MDKGYGSKVIITPEYADQWIKKQNPGDPDIQRGLLIGEIIAKALEKSEDSLSAKAENNKNGVVKCR